MFPLGLASVRSQAASPLLGHVLAQTGVIGHTIVVVLLVGSGLAIAVSLVIRPPRDVPAATIRLVLGLSSMFVLAPSTRFGYFIYPAAMILWLLVSQAGRRSAADPDPEDFEALTIPVDPGPLIPVDPGPLTLPEDPEDPKVLATPASGLAPLPAWCAALPGCVPESLPGPRLAQLPHGSQPGSWHRPGQAPQGGIAVVLATVLGTAIDGRCYPGHRNVTWMWLRAG